MPSLFDVANEHLTALTAERAVDLFRKLLLAEANRLGVGIQGIDVPSSIYVADGGIDAKVEGVPENARIDLFLGQDNFYQIKTGDFRLTQRGKVREILFESNGGNLHQRVKDCFDRNGVLYVVTFGYDLPETKESKVRDLFFQEITNAAPSYDSPRIDIVTQNKLRSYFSRYPSLCLELNGHGDQNCQLWETWQYNDDMIYEFRLSDSRKEVIAQISNKLLDKEESAVHIRIRGEPGVGKTRVALEATKCSFLKPLVLYFESPSQFFSSNLLSRIEFPDLNLEVILVIDECDEAQASRIWNRLKNRGKRIKLITLFNDGNRLGPPVYDIDLQPLEEEPIVEILNSYLGRLDEARRFAAFCSGFPRVAHVLGKNLRDNPNDPLSPTDTGRGIWNRYIAGGYDVHSTEYAQRHLVLMYLALFKQVGFKGSHREEFKAVVSLIQNHDPALNIDRCNNIVGQLRGSRVLQGDSTLYITPKLLHIKLWCDWWDLRGKYINVEEFLGTLPHSLLEGFLSMFRYAKESEVAIEHVERLLGRSSPLRDIQYLNTSLGSSFFLALSEASPKSALRALTVLFEGLSREDLLAFRAGRRNIVYALERIGVWQEHFIGAIELLLRLAEAENETYSNNASGVFAHFFSLGAGQAASTEAPPDERYKVLSEVLNSGSVERQDLALNALREALQSFHGAHRMIGAEHQGLRLAPRLWHPKTYEEWLNAYRKAWSILDDARKSLPGQLASRATEILIQHGSSLLQYPDLAEMVVQTFTSIGRHSHLTLKLQQALIKQLIWVLRYVNQPDELQSDLRQQLVDLKDHLEGFSFPDRLRRWVGMRLVEDYLGQQDQDKNSQPRLENQVRQLALEALANPLLLIPELPWLVTQQAANGFLFGYHLGQGDAELANYPKLLIAQQEHGTLGTAFFIAGYFRSLHERDVESWESALDDVAEHQQLAPLVAELTMRSGLTDRAGKRILSLISSGVLSAHHLGLFSYAREVIALSEKTFQAWVRVLLAEKSVVALNTALSIWHLYYEGSEPKRLLPLDTTLEILSMFIEVQETLQRPQDTDDHIWIRLASNLLSQDPSIELKVAEFLLRGIGRRLFTGVGEAAGEMLSEIASSKPREVWGLVVEYLPGQGGIKDINIPSWLRGTTYFESRLGALDRFPPELLWEWVDSDVEKRAWFAAFSLVFPSFDLGSQGMSFARELLVRYGDREDVRHNLFANFLTTGWVGDQSDHLANLLAALQAYSPKEKHTNVLRWIDDFAEYLNREIERAKAEEERERYN